jgi:thioredoxin 1
MPHSFVAAAFSSSPLWGTRASRMIPLSASSELVIVNLDDSNYRKLLGSGDKAVLVDACAPWCGPCKLIEPVVERCAKNRKDTLVVARFDVESKSPDLKVELLLQNAMPRSLPSLILFHNQEAIAKWNGVITDEELEDFLSENIPRETTSTTAVPEKSPKTGGSIGLSGQNEGDYMLTDLN